MAIYVDNAQIRWRGKRWCHLVADTLEELHYFAQGLGLKRAWFQADASLPHYDVTVEVRAVAVRLGAIQADRRTLITCGRRLKTELAGSLICDELQLSLFD